MPFKKNEIEKASSISVDRRKKIQVNEEEDRERLQWKTALAFAVMVMMVIFNKSMFNTCI